MTQLNKSGRKQSSKGQAVRHNVSVKAKISKEMEFEVTKKKVAADPPVKKKVKVPVESKVVSTLKKQITDAKEGRALVPVDTEDMPVLKLRRISKLNNKSGKMRSILGDEAENIHQLIEIGDADNATSLIYKRVLQVLVDLLPYAEHNVRASKGQRGVYQVNSLIQSVRELMVDLQSAQDRGAMGEMLVENIVRPLFLDIAMSLVKELAEIKSAAKDLMTDEDFKRFLPEVSSAKDRVGHTINNSYESARDQTRQFLQR